MTLLSARARLRDQRGFTLVEVLIGMVITLVVLGVLTDLFVSGHNNESVLRTRVNAQEQVLTAFSTLRADAHFACNATVTGTGSPTRTIVTFSQPTQASLLTATGSTCTVGTDASQVSWCPIASGSTFTLFRVPGAAGSCLASTSGAHIAATSLTSPTIFELVAKDSTRKSLSKLHVDLPISSTSGRSTGSYRLIDDFVLLNCSSSSSSCT